LTKSVVPFGKKKSLGLGSDVEPENALIHTIHWTLEEEKKKKGNMEQLEGVGTVFISKCHFAYSSVI